MKKDSEPTKCFKRTIVDYAYEKRSTFPPPPFSRKDMMQRTGLSELEFNTEWNRLAPKYFSNAHPCEGEPRYQINLTACDELRDQLDEHRMQERRHRENVWLAVLLVIFGALLTTVLASCFLKA